MTSETFEQVLAAAQADGAFTPAWKKFVNTRFFVPVLRPPGTDPKHFTLNTAHDGGRAILISEVRERIERHYGAALTILSGADVVRMLDPEAAIMVALGGQPFNIASERVEWLKKGIEASQARAAAKAQPPLAPAPAAPAPLPVPTPVSIAKPAPAPAIGADPATPALVRRNQGGTLDVAALKPRSVALPKVGLEFFVPGEWRDIQNSAGLQFSDEASGTVLKASGSHRPNVSLAQWQGMCLALVAHEMRSLAQDGDTYAIDGEGWRDRVKGTATEFAGTFTGDDGPSRYLVACIWIDGTVASLTIRAPAEVFEQNRSLYKWLLSRVDLLESAAIEARIPAGRQAREFEHEHAETPAIFGLSMSGRITRLQALAYSFPVWLPIAALGIVAALVLPKNPVLGGAMVVLGALMVLWLALRLLVLRLHDTNISGKWILYYLGMALAAGILRMPLLMGAVLVVGWLAMMVFYCLVPGTPDDNDYGPPPGENSGLVKFGAAMFILLQVASVAGPAKVMNGPGGFQNAFSFPSRGADASAMTTFEPEDGSFLVDMPGTPEEVRMPPQAGGVAVHMYQLAAPERIYIAQSIHYGDGHLDQVGTMEAMQADLVGQDGRLIEAKTILLNGLKGREVRVALPNGVLRAARYIIVGSKIRMVMIMANSGPDQERHVEQYLTSFRLPW
jgi:uncharacterized membrane protein YhaH (DUF805 family)